jgi:hypothetical protein
MKRSGLLVLGVAVLAGTGSLRAQGIPLSVKQTEHCSAFAPGDWSLTANPQASAVDANSGDHSMYAGWGGFAVNRAMQQYYGPLYGDPETSIRTVLNMIVTAMGDPGGVSYSSAPEPFLGYFSLRRVESAQYAGLVFYHVYPGAGPQFYVESIYMALAHKRLGPAGVRTAAGVAVSLRCQTQLIPVRFDPPASTGKRAARTACGTGGNLRGYNKELGTQYAHSPSTGQNFLFDPATDWRENGPEGPGYYRSAGNSFEKLELGRDDDC